jgi:peptidoglycan hydrolase-like protein with peptidoglycan-binding domain
VSFHPWQTMDIGDEGADVTHLQKLLAGGDRRAFDAQPGKIDGFFGPKTAAAVKREKFHIGYPAKDISARAGQRLRGYLVDDTNPAFTALPADFEKRMAARKGQTLLPTLTGPPYPLAVQGTIIGRPYQGTHNHPGTSDPLHNWESCNAIDIATPIGTRVIAVADGVIGSQIGALGSSSPVLEGLRLHLQSADNEWYYAHLSKLGVRAGDAVSRGDELGLSGEANGVQHLHLGQHHGDPGALIGDPTSGYVDKNYPG